MVAHRGHAHSEWNPYSDLQSCTVHHRREEEETKSSAAQAVHQAAGSEDMFQSEARPDLDRATD